MSDKKNLMYLCVFFNKQYLELLELVAFSIKCYGSQPENLDILIFTNKEFKPQVESIFKNFKINAIVEVLDKIETKFEACCSRLFLFNWDKIDEYNKLLYIDTDVLVTGNLNKIFNLPIKNELYGVKEGYIKWRMWGADYFDFNRPDIQKNKSGISSGVMLFLNTPEVKKMFNDIIEHINEELIKHDYATLENQKLNVNPVDFSTIFGDQPFIVYHGVMSNLLTYESRRMFKHMAPLNPTGYYEEHILCHFSGDPGRYDTKINKMRHYLKSMVEQVGVKDGTVGEVRIVTPSNISPENTKELDYLKYTASIFGYTLDVIGVNQNFHYLNKIRWLNDYLNKKNGTDPDEENGNEDDIIIFTDAYDTFFVSKVETIVEKFKNTNHKILWSVEKLYMHHKIDENQELYDKWAKHCGYGYTAGYNYINSGGFMGYRKELKQFINDVTKDLDNQSFMFELNGKCKSCRKYCDQQVYGHFLARQYRELKNKYNVKLDVNCDVFYNASVDANNFNEHINITPQHGLQIKKTSGYPCLVHVPWKKRFGHLLTQLFEKTFCGKFYYKSYTNLTMDKEHLGAITINNQTGKYRIGDKWIHAVIHTKKNTTKLKDQRDKKEKRDKRYQIDYKILFFNNYKNYLAVNLNTWEILTGHEISSNSDP
jgi:hypothetical protein